MLRCMRVESAFVVIQSEGATFLAGAQQPAPTEHLQVVSMEIPVGAVMAIRTLSTGRAQRMDVLRVDNVRKIDSILFLRVRV